MGNREDDDHEHDPLIGTMVGRYRVEEMIGHGGMGSVYSILQPAIHKRMALKLLHEEYVDRKDVVQRFFDEARAVNLIGHPNIVDIHDFSNLPDGRPFIIMEFLEGQSLEDYLEEKEQLPAEEVLAIFKQVTSALAAAHAKEIVHRDLKPDNLFLTSQVDGSLHVKVLDFGIAKLENQALDISLTQTGVVMGTPTYMSPEQAMGNSQSVNCCTDIYSLGIILYELLVGIPPYVGKSFAELILKHIQGEIPNLCTERPDLPLAWNSVLQKAMAKAPEQRYQSTRELYVAMEAAYNGVDLSPAAEELEDEAEAVAGLSVEASIETSVLAFPNTGTGLGGAPLATPAPETSNSQWVSNEGHAVSAQTLAPALAQPEIPVQTEMPAQVAASAPEEEEAFDLPPAISAKRKFIVIAALLGAALAGFLILRGGDSSSEKSIANGPVVIAPFDASQATPVAVAQTDAALPSSFDAAVSGTALPDATPPDATLPEQVASPPPTPKQTSPQAPRTPKGKGLLWVRSNVWVDVYLDGKKVGVSPYKKSISSGRHRVRLFNDNEGSSRRYRFTLKPGGQHQINAKW